ncbi:MAG: hypothetical protein IPH69_17965 [Bacteroidales bacterium]|nr:hypothetical protein [Bacteroidales bacterium]
MSETGKKWVLGIASTIFLLSFLTMLGSSGPYNNLIDTIYPILIPFLLITLLTGSGMLLYGFRCLFQIKKNHYLKYISLIACVVIAYGSYVFASKMTGEGVPVLELIYFVPAFLLTLIVLFSLPFSGYIHWITLHKRILKKIMIPWIFFFIVFSVSIVSPDLIRKIITKEDKKKIEFRMNDYEVKNKNGLEPE